MLRYILKDLGVELTGKELMAILLKAIAGSVITYISIVIILAALE